MWIKICGNTSLEDTLLAIEAGADAVGFVFAPSPRQVTVDEVAQIIPHLPVPHLPVPHLTVPHLPVPHMPQTVDKIGVFVEAGFDEIVTAVETCGLTGVQLHGGNQDADKLAKRLRERFGSRLLILRVVHFSADAATQIKQIQVKQIEVEQITSAAIVDAILVDSRTVTAVGGTGKSFDWAAAKGTIFAKNTKLADSTPDRRLRLVVAGGLHPGNVAEAIQLLQPWGVDVVSGVEAAPGRKDASKIKSFIQLARQTGSDDCQEDTQSRKLNSK